MHGFNGRIRGTAIYNKLFLVIVLTHFIYNTKKWSTLGGWKKNLLKERGLLQNNTNVLNPRKPQRKH